uniref:Tripartite motif-containing protein 71 (TRIM71) n=2 Tax=environmental samples TaxID=651140 RepID=A0A075HE90_9ARCH|nr:tripartite motif-containing protein 71 (TRIM71) [uncultured marine thaumarchaeote KM3_54_H01]AIF12325.1 tripartite motif-containing protein 71 (TRIM71) [uncultured marine thaumarchaeote KM3_55_A12]
MKYTLLFVLMTSLVGVFMIPNAFAENVPDWIKNNAGWWATDQIDDSTFLQGIQFLIKEGIMIIPPTETSESSQSQEVPAWVKNNAGWWATDAISETEFLNAIQFLIEFGLISISNYNCNQNDDLDRNGIPDIIEETPVLSGMPTDQHYNEISKTFENKNWSNCYFPKDLSFYKFYNTDLSYSDFSDAKLFNTLFDQSNLLGADFSNTNLQGSVFFASDLSHTNFENADFSTDNWEEPFLIFTYEIHKDRFDQNLEPLVTTTFSCYYNPCQYHRMFHSGFDNKFYTQTFGENLIPLNIKLVDLIADESDRRSIWRHHTAFVDSSITETIFTGSDLSYAKFLELDINNVDFTDADLSNAKFSKVNLNNVKPADNLPNGFIDAGGLLYPPNTELNIAGQDISDKKFTTLDDLDGDNFNIMFDHALDYPPINWSMGMTIYDEKLYVADTDNHRIIVYDLKNYEKLLTFTSPIQNHCDSTHNWTAATDCTTDMRNLPTSIEIIDEKIFVAYGFQDEIQVFDLDGNYLWKFGSSGTQAGEFNMPHRLSAVNNELFVADSENHRIQVFDTDGNFLRQFGTHGDYVGQLNHPIDVHAYDSQIFVADSARASILVFDLNGKFMREFEVNQNVSDISTPYGVFVYDNLIFVSDVGDFSVKVFDLDGNLVKKFGQHGDRYGEFKFPLYTVTDGKKIFVSDAYNYRIQIFNITP